MISIYFRINLSRVGSIAILVMLVLGSALLISPAQSRPDVAQNSPSFWFRLLVPDDLVPSRIGHASFRLGSDMVLVFAARLPVRQAALQEVSGVSVAKVVHLPDATILRIPLLPGQSVHAVPAAGSFHIVLGPPEGIEQAKPSFIDGQIVFATASADRTITYAPSAASTLLIGTVTSGMALDRALEGPGYAIIPADNGIVIATRSDELALAPGRTGFHLHSTVRTLDLPVGNPPVSGAQLDAPHQPSGLDLPRRTLVALRHRIESAQRRVAHADALDLGSESYRLAKTLIAAGLGQEARGVLTDMLRDDPATIDDPQRRLLLGIADVVADRPPGDWPKLATTVQRDDEALWTGIAKAESGNTAGAADLLSRRLALLMALPRSLRAQFLPLVAETLIAAGSVDAARTLLHAEAGDRTLALARAELLQADKHPRQALGVYQSLFKSADQRVAGIARFRSIMLRYQLHQIDAAVAAASLSRHIYDWGGDRHALTMRLALAKVLARSGDQPRAFTMLTTAGRQFPHAAARILQARQAMFDRLVTSGNLDRLPPLAAVSILKNNMDLIPPGAAGIPVLRTLSKQLIALGLSDQAVPVLQQVVARAPTEASRSRFGAALAKLDFVRGDPKQAESVLEATAGSATDPGVVQLRADLANEITAQTGPQSALSPLTGLTDPQALVLAANRAERHRDWPLVEATMRRLAALTVPQVGLLDQPNAQIIVRWASAARRAHDGPTLETLRNGYLSRMPQGKNADLFAAITAPFLTSHASLSDALAQIKAIEKVGDAVGPISPK